MKKKILLVFTILLLWICVGPSVYADESPWYKKAWQKWLMRGEVEPEVIQDDPVRARIPKRTEIPEEKVAPEDLPERLSSNGYQGPDLSKERSIEDELLIRTFPLPQSPVPQPPRKPPTPGQYSVPEPKLPRRDMP